ncbi:metal ABC transporter substrate-binding protein [Clostridium oryzae]|uniref:High-affinity zinc uptake system binding-protein ZnuA n=1 Tax=Clostridium oryzae TaxID=1450648 RepID=A0A1V4IU53_9CLOT|nr:metal ABC transporter substrate-binding protein [Clostridium oryzae]OPJ63466.1 high-affinity zinc uptake system binding-protein ZnuA precursor [Clostridium oryzae]
MKKYICIILFLALSLTGCSITTNEDTKPKVKPKVNTTENLSIITTNKLLYYMTKDIVKENHDVDYMLLTENEQWSYEYTEDALNNIANKDLFIYFGADFEPWINDFLGDIKNGRVTSVNGSRGTKIVKLENPVEYGDATITDNPYYWMNPSNYKILMSNIKNAIQEKDPQNRKIYETNFNENMKELSELQKSADDNNELIDKTVFVTFGDTFDYLAQGLGIKLVKVYEDTDKLDIEEDLDQATSDEKSIIFLTDGVTLPENCRELINKYKMKRIKVQNYSYDSDYIELLDKNYEAINQAISEESE